MQNVESPCENISPMAVTKFESEVISVNLLEASYKSSTFPNDWSIEKRLYELKRYEMFLLLASKNPGTPATPTREIDEFWHLHMLSPVAYCKDTTKLFRRIFDHDGGFGLGHGELDVLRSNFRKFASLWYSEYQTEYVPNFTAMDGSSGLVNCWHDCQDRCWHACSSDDLNVIPQTVT